MVECPFFVLVKILLQQILKIRTMDVFSGRSFKSFRELTHLFSFFPYKFCTHGTRGFSRGPSCPVVGREKTSGTVPCESPFPMDLNLLNPKQKK